MLETRKVFIDTQYFVKSNFNFSSRSFVTLQELCKKNELQYILTSVVEQEVESKIELSIKDALSSLQSFRKKANILSTIDDPLLSSFFNDVKEEDIYEKANAIFHGYNKECKYKYVEADKIDPEELLDLYFCKKPPFGDGKKKAEFPDAISLLSIESILDEGEKIYVVSDDQDLKSYCTDNQQLIAVDSLEKLLDMYNLHTNALTVQVKEYLEKAIGEIKNRVSDYISGCEVYNSSSWDDADVTRFYVNNVGDFEINVIEISDEECKFNFDVQVDIYVEVTGPDFTNGMYDREDGYMYTFRSTTRDETIPIELECELDLKYEFDAGSLQNIDLGELYIQNTSGGIEVSIEENPEPDWY